MNIVSQFISTCMVVLGRGKSPAPVITGLVNRSYFYQMVGMADGLVDIIIQMFPLFFILAVM